MLHWIKSLLTLLLFGFLLFISSCGGDDEVESLLEAEGFSTTIDENPADGLELGTISATTNLGSIQYSLASEDVNNGFDVNSSSGVVSVNESSSFDFETNPVVTGVVSVTDGTKTLQVAITVNLNDVTGTVTASDFSTTIDENPTQGQSLGTVIASTSTGTLTYSVNQSQPEGALFVNANTGELIVQDVSAFDFDTNPTVSGVVDVSNREVTEQANVTIQLNDIDETIGFTIWTGPSITFTKGNFADPALAANQDRINGDVWITRGNAGGAIYNANTESMVDDNTSPEGTEWAVGITANLSQLTFAPFRQAVDPQMVPEMKLVLYLIAEDVYLDVEFNSWTKGKSNGGGFSYTRSTAP